jgi:hypothetical protein
LWPRCRAKARPGDLAGKSRFLLAREFVAAEGCEEVFERVYGPEGIWSKLLMLSPQYLGSELREESKAERRYRIFDYWRSHEDFEFFRGYHRQAYEKFSQWIQSEKLIERETVLGSFYESDSDSDEGTGLVPA